MLAIGREVKHVMSAGGHCLWRHETTVKEQRVEMDIPSLRYPSITALCRCWELQPQFSCRDANCSCRLSHGLGMHASCSENDFSAAEHTVTATPAHRPMHLSPTRLHTQNHALSLLS